MKTSKLLFAIIATIIIGCDQKQSAPRIYKSTVLVDVSDTAIINLFKKDIDELVNKLAPELNRNEAVNIRMSAIGGSVENSEKIICFPGNGGVISLNAGNYELQDSNQVKNSVFKKRFLNELSGFRSSVANNESQIFYTIVKALSDNPNSNIYIYSDLLENYRDISFYRTDYNLEEVCNKLMNEYGLENSNKPIFKGRVIVVSPIDSKNQQAVFKARIFYKILFVKMGIKPEQYEFIGGTITKSKF